MVKLESAISVRDILIAGIQGTPIKGKRRVGPRSVLDELELGKKAFALP